MTSKLDLHRDPRNNPQPRMDSSGKVESKLEFSCEFFPPKGPRGQKNLLQAVQNIQPLAPELFTVTYGAGGSTQERTHNVVSELSAPDNPPIAGHITCVGATQDEVHSVVDGYVASGIRHLVAIRGDKPADQPDTPGGYATAAELVAGLRSRPDGNDLTILVAAYPEVHPKAASPEADIESLKEKVDAGADRLVTQFFFDNDDFYRFREAVAKAGITVPLIPGILPIGNFERNVGFAQKCGAKVPTWIPPLFEGLTHGGTVANMIGASLCVEQCRDLQTHGVHRFHFYTMNRGEMTAAVWRQLSNRRPGEPEETRKPEDGNATSSRELDE